MTGQSELVTKVVFELAISQFAYVISAVARRAGPSVCPIRHEGDHRKQIITTALWPVVIYMSDKCYQSLQSTLPSPWARKSGPINIELRFSEATR